MCRYFDDIFCGIGMRLREERDYNFVDPLTGVLVDELTEYGTSGLERMFQSK